MDSAGGVVELVYKVRLEGAQEIEAGAKASERWTDAEKRVAEALQRTSGPLQNLVREQRNLNAARELGLGGNLVSDLEGRVRNAQRRVDNAKRREQYENNPNTTAVQAFLSSRFGGGGGGLMPLVGQSIKAVAGESGIDAVMSLASKLPPQVAAIVTVATLAIKAAQALFQMGVESSRVTQQFSDLRRQVGGTTLETARAQTLSRITGVDAGGASRSFNDRITSDALAMGLAAQLGISNTPGLYGHRDFGRQYQSAIERTAAISDRERRERTADALGIGQEVNRYNLIGGETRNRINRFGDTSARINNPEEERKSAELQAAIANEAQARENLKTSLGHLFNSGGHITNIVNEFADAENYLANQITSFTNLVEPASKFFEKLFPHRLARKGVTSAYDKIVNATDRINFGTGTQADQEILKDRDSKSNGGQTVQSQQLQATRDLTAALLKNAGVYGGGERAASAAPSGLRGANLHRALQSGGLRFGYL